MSSRNVSRAGSRASDRESDMEDRIVDFENDNTERKAGKLKPEKLQFNLENPDNMASLLGHFDLNTRQGTMLNDESTLKANENRSANAPTDFSQLS